MIRSYVNNPFDNVKDKFQEVEFMNLLSCTVSVKENSNTKNVRNMMFMNFLKLKEDNKYNKLLYNAKMMKGWKHNNEVYNGKTKNDWFQFVKMSVPECTLSTYSDDGSLRGLDLVKNPYIIVDLDNVTVSDQTLNKINSLEYVMGTGISISGEGFWSIVRISENIKTKDEFRAIFNLLAEEFKNIGLYLDTQCSNVNRLRVLSPYDFDFNDNFCDVFEPNIDIKPAVNLKSTENKKYDLISTSCLIPNRFKIYGKENENYYREATDLSLEYPLDESGRNYHILYSYANAIYRGMGEDGYNTYVEYFPETNESILRGYWESARGWKGSVKGKILRELENLGFIEQE